MNAFKIAALVFAVFCINSIQSMEPAVDEYAIDRQFLEGNISVNDYLSHIARLSGDYAYKIRAIRNMAGQVKYAELLGRLKLMPQMAQNVLASGNRYVYEQMLKSLRETQILRTIDILYNEIEHGVNVRHGRES